MSTTRDAAELRFGPALAVPGVVARLAGPGLVVAATTFNVVLCFINTQHWATIGSGPVIAVSLLIVLAGLWIVRGDVTSGLAGTAVLVALGVAALRLLNTGLEAKILFDLLIAPVFFLLGRHCTVATAERMLVVLMALVVPVGFFELLLPDTFVSVLDILGFYTAKGVVSADAINYSGSRFFASAERAGSEGRTMLPQLFGPHRVSSIFLEPISLGNFALICLAWLLSVRQGWTGLRITLAIGTALCIILPDSRQAAATFVMMAALRVSPWRETRWNAAVLPLLVLAALVVWGDSALAPGEAIGIGTDDFRGRLLFSGKLLASWDWGEWFGLSASDLYTADTGYAYLLNNLGLPLTLIVWVRAISMPAVSAQAKTMRGMMALYTATSLCVGASFFSIKSAALLWFLFGAAQDGAGRHPG